MTLKKLRLGIMAVVSIMPMATFAEIPEQLRDAARKAVVSNPEVQAK